MATSKYIYPLLVVVVLIGMVAVVMHIGKGTEPPPWQPKFTRDISILIGHPMDQDDLAKVDELVKTMLDNARNDKFAEGTVLRVESAEGGITPAEFTIPSGQHANLQARRADMDSDLRRFYFDYYKAIVSEVGRALPKEQTDPLDYAQVNLPGYVNDAVVGRAAHRSGLLIVAGSPIYREWLKSKDGQRHPYKYSMTPDLVPDRGNFCQSFPASRYGAIGAGAALQYFDVCYCYTLTDGIEKDRLLMARLREFWNAWGDENGARSLCFRALRDSGAWEEANTHHEAQAVSETYKITSATETSRPRMLDVHTGEPADPPDEPQESNQAKIKPGDRLRVEWEGTDEFDVTVGRKNIPGTVASAMNPVSDLATFNWQERFNPQSPTNVMVITFLKEIPLKDIKVSLVYVTAVSKLEVSVRIDYQRGKSTQEQGPYRFQPSEVTGDKNGDDEKKVRASEREIQLNIDQL